MFGIESPFLAKIMSTIIPMDFYFLDLKYTRIVHIECFNDMAGVQGLTSARDAEHFH